MRFLARFSFRSPQSRRREVDPSTLPRSFATLVVVPSPLMEHWRDQIELHTTLLRNVYFDSVDGHRVQPLPPAEELAKYDLVVITKERLTYEWTHHRPCCALDVGHLFVASYGGLNGSLRRMACLQERTPFRYADDQFRPPLSELLRLRWLRVVVDEGHSLGSLGVTDAGRFGANSLQLPEPLNVTLLTHVIMVGPAGLMAACLEAERRWVMTGTPTKNAFSTDLTSIRGLLRFLREEPYGSKDETVWNVLIARPWPVLLAKNRLVELLKRLMIRNVKEAIKEIPKPDWHEIRLRMSALEAKTYNALVTLVQANLLTTGMEGGGHPPGMRHPDSMLNPANFRHAQTVMHNVRLACCGGGSQVVTLDRKSISETVNLCRHYGGSDADVARIAEFCRRGDAQLMSECQSCGVKLQILLLTPCMHLVCCRCMKGRNNACSLCGTDFCVDTFQLLQPGFHIHWRADDIVLGPEQEEQHDDGSWDVISKARHLVTTLRQYVDHPPKRSFLPLKALVFSQFRSYLNGLQAALLSQGFKVAAFFGKGKHKELERFRTDPSVQVMLTGR
jgi:SNF2 family DNA or RNA helicase